MEEAIIESTYVRLQEQLAICKRERDRVESEIADMQVAINDDHNDFNNLKVTHLLVEYILLERSQTDSYNRIITSDDVKKTRFAQESIPLRKERSAKAMKILRDLMSQPNESVNN